MLLFEDSFLLYFYSIVVDITFVLTSILFVFVVFCIFTQSKTMGIYKFYMLYSIVASYAFDIVLWMWKPIPLLPVPAFASGHLFKNFGSSTGYTLFTIFIAAVAHYTLALSMSVLYRYMQVFPGRIQNCMNKSRLTPISFALAHIAYYEVFVLPSNFIRQSVDEIANEMSKNMSVYEAKILVQNYSVMYFSKKIVNITILDYNFDFFGYPIAQCFLFGWLANYAYASVFTSFLHGIYMMKFWRTMRKPGMKNSRRLHIMFCKAITAQITLGGILLMLPEVTVLGLMFLSYYPLCPLLNEIFEYGSIISIFCLMSMSSHALVEYVLICYFITPYRKFIVKMAKKVYGKITRKEVEKQIETVKSEITIMRSGSLSLANAERLDYLKAKRRATISVSNHNGQIV